ncbi:MAG: bifunctional pyr operon transcriptional regulator/uracil phosphoribosyltransferase, partial [Chloroflexi bacterium]|nr:bifunctional pyr operon transcriptional regulator/uracil phosphoribosyltransferase [Chloroflexota bacterium]
MARQVMNAEEIRRALTRISHEIIEKEGTEGLVVDGIQRRGVPLA